MMMLVTDSGEHCVQALNREVWVTGSLFSRSWVL